MKHLDGKVVVVTGAMKPERFVDSDAHRAALTAVLACSIQPFQFGDLFREGRPRALALGRPSVEEAVAASPSPGVAAERCLRHEDPDFDRYFLAETPPRTATEADCRFACTDEGSTYHSWCNTYEFLTSTPGTGLRQFTSTCRLYAVGQFSRFDIPSGKRQSVVLSQ